MIDSNENVVVKIKDKTQYCIIWCIKLDLYRLILKYKPKQKKRAMYNVN